jgi:hypothetical protein
VEAIKKGPLSYARPKGDGELVKELSNFYGPLLNRDIDALNEIIGLFLNFIQLKSYKWSKWCNFQHFSSFFK